MNTFQSLLRSAIIGLLVVASVMHFAHAAASDDDSFEISSYRRYRTKSYPAYVTHGINAYNGKKIFDFSEASAKLSGLPPLVDVGVYNPDPTATNASEITEETPSDSLIATIFPYLFSITMGAGKPAAVGPFNVPISQTPTLSMASKNISDRSEPASFEDSDEVAKQGSYAAYRNKGDEITLKDYNSAWGRMKIMCNRDGTGSFKIKIKGIPLGLYTAWEIVAKNPLTEEESLMASPFGGAPNVIAADKRGYGKMERRLNFCPMSKCEGSDRCTVGVIMAYHADHMIYGSAPDLRAQGLGPGTALMHHMMFLTNGQTIE